MLVFGTRPEAIKMAPLVRELYGRSEEFRTIVCVTGQHRSMLDQVLEVFEIAPDFDLDIMRPGQDLYDVTSRVLVGMREVFRNVCPDFVLVHGDTTTSTAAALAAFYSQVPVGHVEAGLRTNNVMSPWPEEMNRQITSRIASLHFAPTSLSRENLLRENVADEKIVVTGNTVIDALQAVVAKISDDRATLENADKTLSCSGYDTSRLTGGRRRIVLVTGHRRENFGAGIRSVCLALKDLAERFSDVDFVYPMHLNPNVRGPIAELFGEKICHNLFFIEPLEYLSFVRLMSLAHVVLTDSGGIQEEAPGLGKPVLVMRDTTERPEAVASGTVRLVGTDREKIVSEMSALLTDDMAYEIMSRSVNPYGDGLASKRIADKLSDYLNCKE
ncbi:MAG: UDP-N-acetylglucosamine 2-epimerase (non-hydrolyzing) [Muribaculaceae bacterium]|nr:UDP-N-acetylglucosamine 2-epimerase (non-hydrolyzing) [Muribaculaceae bacterium]